MKLRDLRLLAATASLAFCGTALAADAAKSSAKSNSSNQQLADAIAAKLTASGAAMHADVTMQVSDGVVTLTGTCRDAAAKDQIIQQVRTVKGVTKVRDGLSVGGLQMVQAQQPVTLPPTVGPVASPALTAQMPSASSGPGLMIEPMPMGQPGMGSVELNAPPLPPYAWPTYAPYNNVSRVAYPNAYPYNAFPFIGPYYPFPKVPLGWRKVTLEWEDGHWWYGRLQTPNDYWRVRFW